MPADPRAIAIEALALAEAATPGPWRAGRNGPISMVVSDPTKAQLRCDVETGPEGGEPDDDARLIAHAGTHYATLARALIAALDEREALLADLPVVIEAAKREAATLDHEVEVCDAGFRGNARELEERARAIRAAIERLEGRIG